MQKMAVANFNSNFIRTDKRIIEDSWNKFSYFLHSEKYVDVKFLWKNNKKRVGAHRVILAASSTYFDQLFQTRSNRNEIYIENIDPEIFSLLIRYCYSGALCPNKQNVHTILKAAAVLKLDEAAAICVAFLKGPQSGPQKIQRIPRVNPAIIGANIRTVTTTVAPALSPATEYSILAVQKSEGLKDNESRIYRSDQCDKRWLQYGIITRTKKFSDIAYSERELIFVGGCLDNGEPTNRVETFNLETQTWKELTPMKSCRGEVCIVTVKGTIYAIGGYGRDQEYPLKTAEKYDIRTGQWSSIPDMTVARRNATAVAVGDLIYVLGGFGSDWEFLRSVECYNVSTSSWTECADMHNKRFGCGASVLNDLIYAIGSGNVPPYSRDVECYNPKTNAWTKITPLEVERHGVSGVTFNGQLLAVGGSLPNYYKGFVDVYNPVQNIWTKAVPLPSGGNYKCFIVPTEELVKMESTRKRSTSLSSA